MQDRKREKPAAAARELGAEFALWESAGLWLALAGVLVVMALRMSMTEAVRQSIAMKSAALAAANSAGGLAVSPEVGPSVTIGFAVMTLACAGVAALSMGRRLSREMLGWLVVAGLFAGLGTASTLHAANKFAAMVGTIDVGMAVVAGWTVCVVCGDRGLGLSGRRLVLMVVAGLLAAWTAKGFLQRFDELPQMLEFYKENKAAVWQQQGFKPGDPGIILFEGRMNSGEVTGFISFSNNVAAGFVGLVAAMLAVCLVTLQDVKRWGERGPLTVIGLVGLGILTVLGIEVTVWTHSRGGTAMEILAVLLIVAGFFVRGVIGRWRWVVTGAVVLVILAGAGVIVAYGVKHDNLRDKSMTFRWYYWTGAVPMVKQSPLVGVGLGNFGDYYLTTKRPSAPEDVKDPHSTFVRLVSEMGWPAAAVFAGLAGWLGVRAIRRRPVGAVDEKAGGAAIPERGLLLILVLTAIAWWFIQFAVASPEDAWFAYLAVGFVLLTIGAGWVVWKLTQAATTDTMRFVQGATLVGAVCMLLYDQINMALVTGPVAMFFWVLLGFAGSGGDEGKDVPATAGRAVGGVVLAGSVVLAGTVWISVSRMNHVWDPAPYEWEALRGRKAGDAARTKAAIDMAATLNPRSVDVLGMQIRVWNELRLPTADLVRKLLSIDRSNARPRVDLAMVTASLTREERIAYLQEALVLDAALAADEPKRLSKETIQQVREKIRELQDVK